MRSLSVAERYRKGFHHAAGLRAKLGVFLDSIHLIHRTFRHPREDVWGPAGMLLF